MKNGILILAMTLIASIAFAELPKDVEPPSKEAPLTGEETKSGLQNKCGDDFKMYCMNIKDGAEMEACMKDNVEKFSPECAKFLRKLKIAPKETK